jgi:hypothetical protein
LKLFAHLGVRDYLLIDPDRLDKTNLNRVVGTTKKDVGRWKVRLCERMIKKLVPTANVRPVNSDILDGKIAQLLTLLGRTALWQNPHLVPLSNGTLGQLHCFRSVTFEVEAKRQARRQGFELPLQISPHLRVFGLGLGN